MKIKRKIPKLLSILLSFTISFTNILPAYATEVFISESLLEEMDTVETDENVITNDDLEVQNDDLGAQDNGDSRYEMIEINYNQSSSYYVTIPKTITLGADKRSSYSIKVEGDIIANKQICVVPIDGIEETEVFDFYMKDQTAGSTKEDVIAEVSQSKFYWNYEEVAAGYEENDNYIIADGLSAGKWRGSFQMGISMRTDPSHIHNYVGETTKEPTCTESGEKTYTCDCGDSYTEEIPATGHHYENGECTDCGEKDPNHVHSYTEAVTKEPTCTEAGEKTYTCDCGDSYTEEIPATGHHYENGECTDCGEKDPDYHRHSYTEEITKEPTCTESGEKTYTCDCGDSYTETIPATGHHYGDDDKCADCGKLNPEHEHSYIETITKEPTCTETGEKTLTCKCGDTKTEEIPNKGGHKFVDNICEVCGKKGLTKTYSIGDTEHRKVNDKWSDFVCIDTDYIDASGENKGALFIATGIFSTGASASITGNWYNSSIRTNYNSSSKSDLTDLVLVDTSAKNVYRNNLTGWSLDGDLGEPSINNSITSKDKMFPLSVEEAIKYKNVNINNKEVKVVYDIDLDGEVDIQNKTYSMFRNSGRYYPYVADLGYGTIRESSSGNSPSIRPCYVKPNPHKHVIDGECGTCKECGEIGGNHNYKDGYCVNCGEKDPNHVHSYTEVVTKEPTCTESGEKTYTCDCGDSYTEEIPATGHHYENGECTDCGEKEPAHVHSYTETVTKEPTCTEEGEKTLTCDCGDVKKDVIPKKEHSYTSAVISNKYPWLSHVSDEIWNPQNINNSYITFSGTGTTTDSILDRTSRILTLKVNNKSSSIASVSGSSIYTVQIDTPGWYHVSLSNTTLSYGTGSGTFPSTLNYLYFYANVDDGLYRGYTAYRDKNTNVISESTKFPDRIFLTRGEHTIKATACINTLKSGSSYELKAVNLNIIGNSYNGEICEYCGTYK